MVKLHKYHRVKFSSFSAEKQAKAILKLLCALEANITDNEYRQSIITSLKDCFNWANAEVASSFEQIHKLNQDTSAHAVMQVITPILRVFKHNYDENDLAIRKFDGIVNPSHEKVPFPLTVVLDNLRSAYNVGSIFRTAECLQIKQIILCGITPVPNHPKLLKTAMGTQERVSWQHYADTVEAVKQLKKDGIPIMALETTDKAISLYDYRPSGPVAMIMGNEALGIEEEVLAVADVVLSIPVYGWKNSLNVSNAFALAGYWLSGVPIK